MSISGRHAADDWGAFVICSICFFVTLLFIISDTILTLYNQSVFNFVWIAIYIERYIVIQIYIYIYMYMYVYIPPPLPRFQFLAHLPPQGPVCGPLPVAIMHSTVQYRTVCTVALLPNSTVLYICNYVRMYNWTLSIVPSTEYLAPGTWYLVPTT